MTQPSNPALPRRHFLRQLMVLGGATGAGAIALTSTQLSAAPPPSKRVAADTSTTSKGYRLTDHIRTYYEKAQKI
jgi:hypothetical protein